MKKFKRFILFMLIAAAVALMSCAADDDSGGGIQGEQPGAIAETPAVTDEMGDNNGAADAAEETGGELAFPDLPDIDFGGYEFRILNTADGNIAWLWTQLTAEEMTGEPLNDAILLRNRRIEERFGIEVIQIDSPGPGDVRNTARTSIQAGSDDFDMFMTTARYALALAQEGMLISIDAIPYVDLAQPWWDQDMNRDFSIGDRILFTSGDFSFNQYSATVPILFNKSLHADLGLADPYQLVRDGQWTLDRFGEMGRAALADLSGDGTMSPDDQWGWMAFSHVYAPAILNGVGAGYIRRDTGNLPYLGVNTEHFITRFLGVIDMLEGGWLFDGNHGWGVGRPEPIFLEGRALFWTELMNWAVTLRAMEQDFGILPMPKWDEHQPYHISATGMPHVMCVPATAGNLERTGIILEALNAESRLTTLTVYYDTMLVNQVMRDEQSGEMLDIIFANRVYEIGRFFWEDVIASPISGAMANLNTDIASVIERGEVRMNRAIQNTIDAFLDN